MVTSHKTPHQLHCPPKYPVHVLTGCSHFSIIPSILPGLPATHLFLILISRYFSVPVPWPEQSLAVTTTRWLLSTFFISVAHSWHQPYYMVPSSSPIINYALPTFPLYLKTHYNSFFFLPTPLSSPLHIRFGLVLLEFEVGS